MRLEDETKEGLYEVRAELPGVEPTEDIEVTVRDGQLTIKALRTRTTQSTGSRSSRTGRSPERFHYPQAPTRMASAPPTRGAYLTVSVPLSNTEPTEKHVEVFEVALDDDDIDDEDMYEDDDEDDKDHPSDEAVDQSEGVDQPQYDQGA